MRWSREAVHHILGGPMRANGPNPTLMQWAHMKGVPPANRILYRPTREFRTVAHHAFDGPVRLNCPNASCGHGPTRWSRAAVPRILSGPMRANCPNVPLMQWAHARVAPPANSILRWPKRESRMAAHHIFDGPMQASCPIITCMQWAHASGFAQLLASVGCLILVWVFSLQY